MPALGTIRSERLGCVVSPPLPWHFPVLAECRTCAGTIRRKDSIFAVWIHVEELEGELHAQGVE
jgi:hypothetical protein